MTVPASFGSTPAKPRRLARAACAFPLMCCKKATSPELPQCGAVTSSDFLESRVIQQQRLISPVDATCGAGGNAIAFARERCDVTAIDCDRPRLLLAQGLLTAHGYGPLPYGRQGPETEAAIRAFQRDKGLAADGLVSDSLIAALKAARPG